MTAIEIARKMAAYGQTADAQRAYLLALAPGAEKTPAEELEAAAYLLKSGGDHEIAATTFLSLYGRGLFRAEILAVMDGAYYQPNIKLFQTRYEKNCKLLSKYPYLFRRDFLPFEELPIRFYPFDDKGFVPFDIAKETFAPYVNFNHPVVSRNFFRDLEKPILAADVYSQYELEYLNDNVRPSEWVGKENHIYLHYTSWAEFCAYLQCLNFRTLLEDFKIVFLIGDEAEQYPIDFKERFGQDYSQCPVKPIGVREVTRLIWHAQLSTHQGGDLFNEVCYGHPNLLTLDSIMFDSVLSLIKGIKDQCNPNRGKDRPVWQASIGTGDGKIPLNLSVMNELLRISSPTDKDYLVALFLSGASAGKYLDHAARIAPALFFQPHFYSMEYAIDRLKDGRTMLHSKAFQELRKSSLFLDFKYVKTFSPLRRPTTAYGASMRYVMNRIDEQRQEGKKVGGSIMGDMITSWILNRSFMADWQDRLFKDCVQVRFEDGKLNPRATFTALAAFLDLPYTQSMTYCSNYNGVDQLSLTSDVRGFDPAPVYRTYDEYANDDERAYIEFFMRDLYQAYGYDFHYYDGEPVDEDRVKKWVGGFTTLNRLASLGKKLTGTGQKTGEDGEAQSVKVAVDMAHVYDPNRLRVAKMLMGELRFVNKNGQPLRMMPKLELDPALLEQPLYH